MFLDQVNFSFPESLRSDVHSPRNNACNIFGICNYHSSILDASNLIVLNREP